MKVAPTPSSWPVIMYCRPWTIDTTAITAATPMMMPSAVSTERIRLARRAVKATRMFSSRTISAPSSAVPHVGQYLAVSQRDLAAGVRGDVGLVGHQHDRVAGTVE